MTPKQVVKYFGGDRGHAARELGYNRQTIYDWLKANRIPPRAQLWIQAHTCGQLKVSK